MASSLKDEQDRIRGLLLDTVTLLCRNGLTFKKKLKVQGLLGITLDEENVFIVHFDESLGEVVVDMQDKCSTSTAESDSVRPATANDRTERKSEKKRKATTAELGEPSEKVHIKSEDNDDVVCLEEQPDVKPVPMQALPSYPAEGMYGTYGQLPMSQPPQIMPPVMNANNVSSLPPSVLQTPSSLNTHGLTAYSDGSAITQQMTPEKNIEYGFTKIGEGEEERFCCKYCSCSYKQLRNLRRHQTISHGRQARYRSSGTETNYFMPASLSPSLVQNSTLLNQTYYVHAVENRMKVEDQCADINDTSNFEAANLEDAFLTPSVVVLRNSTNDRSHVTNESGMGSMAVDTSIDRPASTPATLGNNVTEVELVDYCFPSHAVDTQTIDQT